MNNQEAIEFLKGMQGPLVDYADLVGAEGFAYGCRYVYLEPEDYAIELAIAALEEQQSRRWIPVEEKLPDESDGMVLIQVSGKPRENITLHNAFEHGSYIAEGNEGWILDAYPEWENPEVIAWQPLPEPYKPEKGDK